MHATLYNVFPLSVPTISLTTNDSCVAGGSCTLDCVVDITDTIYSLIIDAIVTFSVELASTSTVHADELEGSGDISLMDLYTSHQFTTLTASDAGIYNCTVNVLAIDINYSVKVTYMYTKFITVNVTSKLHIDYNPVIYMIYLYSSCPYCVCCNISQ